MTPLARYRAPYSVYPPVRSPFAMPPRRLTGRQVAGYLGMCAGLFLAFWLVSRVV